MPGEYLGDFPAAGQVIPYYFATYDSNDPTASVTLTGLAVTDIEVYKGTSMTQRASDAGYALIDTDGIDIDSITGIHGFSIDTSDNTDAGFYAAGNDYTVVVSSITVDAGVVSFVAFRFSIDNRGLLRPTTAQRTLDVTATGEAGLDFSNVNLPTGAVQALGISDNGTAQSATGTTLVLRAATPFGADNVPNGSVLWAYGSTQGYWQSRIIDDYDTATDTATVATWDVTPSGTITYIVFGTPPSSAGSPVAASLSGTQTFNMTGNITGNLSGSVGSVTGAVGSVTGAVGSVTGAVGSVTGNVGGNVAGSVASVTGAVGSVTGTVGGIAGTITTLDALDTAQDTQHSTTQTAVAALTSGIITGSAVTGTLSTTVATSDLTGYADDQLIGRVIIWTSGACEGEATDITDYASASGTLTFTALTTAPSNSDTFKIV